MEKPAKEPTGGFYGDLPAFGDFGGFSDPTRYRSAPDSWLVVLADIVGSTKAIGEGRYKDVNMMGAACITSVLNGLKSFDPVPEIPYVFGGDGATLLVPAETGDEVRRVLLQTQALSETRFGLGMRIGIVPVADIRARGYEVRVAKYRLSPGNHLALFSGGGIEAVDALVKHETDGAPYRVETDEETDFPDLEGLTCRWSPITTRRGAIVSLLVVSRETDETARMGIFARVLDRLNDALHQDLGSLSPATDESMRFSWPPKFLDAELRATAGKGILDRVGRIAFILAQSALQWALHRFGGKAGPYDADAYKQELIANTDFRKFDDVLRLILDCSHEQIAAMEACLEELRRTEDICYGLHAADTALMTCLVFSLEQSEHVHFVDGGDGGFAVAAKQLKAQLAGNA